LHKNLNKLLHNMHYAAGSTYLTSNLMSGIKKNGKGTSEVSGW